MVSVLVMSGSATAEVVALVPGVPLEGLLAGDATAVYEAALTAGEPWLLVVEQRTGGVATEVTTPDGDSFELDGPLGDPAHESLWLRPVTAGLLRLTVRVGSVDHQAAYALRLTRPPAGDPRTAAAELESAADLAYSGGGAEGRGAAKRSYEEAAAAWEAAGESARGNECRHKLAVLERGDGNAALAVEQLAAVAEAWGELGETAWRAEALRDLGLARWRLGEPAAAGEDFEESRRLFRHLGRRGEEAVTTINLCLVLHSATRLAEAEACYQEVRPLLHGEGQTRLEGVVLNNLGGIHKTRGEPREAFEAFEDALELQRSDPRGQAEILNNIAVLHRTLGEFEDAVLVYERVLEIQRRTGDRRGEARSLSNLGYAYLQLGEERRALSFLERALPLRREVGDRRGEAATLVNLGETLHALGRGEEALRRFGEALAIQREVDNRSGEAVGLVRIAELRFENGEREEVLADYERAISLFAERQNRYEESAARAGYAAVLASLGRLDAARQAWRAVLEGARSVGARQLEARAHQGLARLELDAGRTAVALAEVAAAVGIVESLRSDLAPPDLRASFLATQREVYELEIEARMAAGEVGAALVASERARSRSLLDVVRGSGFTGLDAGGPLVETRREVERRLRAKAAQRQDAGGEQRAVLDAEIDELLARLDGLEAQLRRADPRYGELIRPPEVTLAAVQAQLDEGTVLVELALGARRSFLWWVTADAAEAVELAPRATIEAAARRVHEALRTPGSGAEGEASLAALGELLFSGLGDRFAGCRRLVVVPDGALHYVPFAALVAPGSEEPLLERCEVVHLPSAAVLAAQRRDEAGRRVAAGVAVVADPVFSAADSRLPEGAVRSSDEAAPLSRLRFSRREAEAIAEAVPEGEEVHLALDFAADRQAVVDGGLDGYRVVHFATHGVLDDRHPALSALVLSRVDREGHEQPGLLSLRDVYGLDLGAELVVLSGCETALGREVRGEGLVGLTRGFMHAGAPRVVASLWRVEDRTTARLMERFYSALLTEGHPPAAALREAQREVRRRRPDPWFWAPFVLQGEWRPLATRPAVGDGEG
ncbi:MAG TPA: CHAT domain-containing protein [Thermoanaerobaculia bacterium]|nr:CHAT domain-containing protein [Thermoanaerobaculia bacterium]